MLSRIKQILGMRIGPGQDPAKAAERRHLAAAALLIAVAKADFMLDSREQQVMQEALQRTYGLSAEDIADLLELAHAESAESSSDFSFTRLINEEFSDAEKSALVREMWQVAYADGNIHKYEEHLIRKIAVLIYVPHSEFIRTKLLAGGTPGPA